MVLASLSHLPGQPQTIATEGDAQRASPSVLSERHRKRKLSANERALEEFFQRNLPQGWNFQFDGAILSLRRIAPVYLLKKSEAEINLLSKSVLLKLAHSEGIKNACHINFKVERHDDVAIVRQRIRLYKEIRRDIEAAHNRLRLRHLCGSATVEECAIDTGQTGEAAREFLTTRQILIDKLEITPIYRIGTLYVYPRKDQCVPEKSDWYVTNKLVPAGTQLLPFEAAEEVEIILRNIEQLKLWN